MYQYKFTNIKYAELDMIPFFRYATESRINQAILAPFNAVAPFIDYTNSDFSLIDNINITETLFETVSNPVINVNLSGKLSNESTGFGFNAIEAIAGGKTPISKATTQKAPSSALVKVTPTTQQSSSSTSLTKKLL